MRMNASHSAVTALANGSKRGAVGRARYAQRYADKSESPDEAA